MTKINKTKQQWQAELTAEQYHVTREKGTERAFSGEYYHCNKNGDYLCVCCQAPLFSSIAKYDSHSGWPSFYQPIDEAAIVKVADHSLAQVRTEVKCSQCDAHLGHVFDDGPEPTGLRYCINSAALQFKEKNS